MDMASKQTVGATDIL